MRKSSLLIILIFFSALFAKGQTTLTTATDFTVTDTHGNSFSLFSVLNSGKYVCLDFFFTTCSACQETCPFFKETYTNYGCNSQDIFFLSIDNGNTDAEVDAYEASFLGGNAGYSAISGTQGGGNAVCSAYGIGAFPTYILIAPNKQIVETDMWPITNAASFDSFINTHSLVQKSCLPAGIIEKTPENSISFYPNPAINNVIIKSSGAEKMNSIKLYDVLGKLLITQLLDNEDHYSLNVSELEKGIYYLDVTLDNNTSIVKKMRKQ